MEFSSIWYFSFWSVVSSVISTTRILALRKATIPVSDFVKIQFVNFIVLCVIFSTSHAFLFRPALEHDQDLNATHRYMILLRFYIDIFLVFVSIICFVEVPSADYRSLEQKCLIVWLLLFLSVGITPYVVKSIRKRFKYSQAIGNLRIAFAVPLKIYPHRTICWTLSQSLILLFASYAIPGLGDLHLQSKFSFVSIIGSCFVFAFYFKKLVTRSVMTAHANEHQKIIEIVLGILGTTLAQYYFRVKSMSLMLGLLSLAFAWLGVLSNLQPHTDLGIFHFLIVASLECAVSLFGLHFYTFLVGCGGIVLMVLRWKLEFVSLRHSGIKETVMRNLKRLEELYGNDSNDSSIQTHDPEQPSEAASNTHGIGIQRRLTRQFERLWSPYARFGA